MRSLMAFVCFLLIGVCVGTSYIAIDTETRAVRWKQNIESVEYIQDLNCQILQAHDYSERLLEAVRMLANENGILCERDAAMVKVVAEYEEENTRLKSSLKEAVTTMQSQQQELNALYEQVERLKYKVQVLEKALENVDFDPVKAATQVLSAADAATTFIRILL
jgi:chromosome segregation ATPase